MFPGNELTSDLEKPGRLVSAQRGSPEAGAPGHGLHHPACTVPGDLILKGGEVSFLETSLLTYDRALTSVTFKSLHLCYFHSGASGVSAIGGCALVCPQAEHLGPAPACEWPCVWGGVGQAAGFLSPPREPQHCLLPSGVLGGLCALHEP